MVQQTPATPTADTPDLSGNWRSFYRYPSSGRGGDEFWGQHVLHATQTGAVVSLKSAPDSASAITMELTVAADGKAASGTWQEQTDRGGYYKGKTYSGTIQFTIDPGAQTMNGIWQGQGSDGEVNSDVWQLTKNNIAQPSAVDGAAA